MHALEQAYRLGIDHAEDMHENDPELAFDAFLRDAYQKACDHLDSIDDMELTEEQQDKILGMFLGGAVGEFHRQRLYDLQEFNRLLGDEQGN